MSLPGNDVTFNSDVIAAVADVVILARNCYSADVEQRADLNAGVEDEIMIELNELSEVDCVVEVMFEL